MNYLLNQLNINLDAPSAWGIYFQDSASPQFEGLVELHDNIMYYLVVILFAVGWILFSIVRNYVATKNPISHKYLNPGTLIKLILTITPAVILMLIAFPSFKLLYLMDEVSDPSISVLAEGHQWYWSYQYPDFLDSSEEFIEYDSYIVPNSYLEEGRLRMLEVDNRVTLPEHTHVRFIITAGDVIHSFACPSLGIKCDPYPGRLNQVPVISKIKGFFYGQCSEICGILHSSMPIFIESVPLALGSVITLIFALLGYAVIPYGPALSINDMNLGIFYMLAVSSLATYGILLAGWSANSKYAFLGSLRSTAQLISYELVLSSAILIVIMLTGSLNFSVVWEGQRAVWFILPLLPIFIIYLVGSIAETNRLKGSKLPGYLKAISSKHMTTFYLIYVLFLCLLSTPLWLNAPCLNYSLDYYTIEVSCFLVMPILLAFTYYHIDRIGGSHIILPKVSVIGFLLLPLSLIIFVFYLCTGAFYMSLLSLLIGCASLLLSVFGFLTIIYNNSSIMNPFILFYFKGLFSLIILFIVVLNYLKNPATLNSIGSVFILSIWFVTAISIFICEKAKCSIKEIIDNYLSIIINYPSFIFFSLIIILVINCVRYPIISFYCLEYGYSSYISIISTFYTLWLPITFIVNILTQSFFLCQNNKSTPFSFKTLRKLDYNRWFKTINLNSACLVIIFSPFLAILSLVFIGNIEHNINSNTLYIRDCHAFSACEEIKIYKLITEWLSSYRGLNLKYRMPISARLFLKESSSPKEVLHLAYNNYRSHFQAYTIPKWYPSDISRLYTISIETKEGSIITLNISDDETLVESVESDSPTLALNSNLYLKVSAQGVIWKNSNLSSKFSTESWVKKNAEDFLKSRPGDPQLNLSPEYLVENRVQTVLINTAQGKSVECNSDNSQIIRSSINKNITINKSGSASNIAYGQSSNMGSILPIRDMTIGQFSTFVYDLSMKIRWGRGSLIHSMDDIRRTDWASFCNFRSFLLSQKLNFISLGEDTGQFCFWISDYSTFLVYLMLKNITIDSFDEINYTHYNDYRLFMHFLSDSGNLDFLYNNAMDQETFDLNISEFSQYPINKMILKMLPKLLTELSNLNNVIKIYFPLKEGGWVPTELQVNELNKINLKWACNISSIFLDSRVNLSDFLKSYDSVSNFLRSFNLSGSLFELLSKERGCSQLDTLLIDLGNKVEEYYEQFDNSRDLLNIVQGIQNNTQKSLDLYGLLFLSEVKLESQGTREEGIVLSQIDGELPSPSGLRPSFIERSDERGNENNIVLETESELPPSPSNEERAHYNDKSVTLKKSPVKYSKATQQILDSITKRLAPMGEGGDNGEGRVNLDQPLPDQPSRGDLESRRDEINCDDPEIKKRKKVKGGVNRRGRLDDNYSYIYGENAYNPQPFFDPVRDSSNGAAAAQPAEEVLAAQPPFDPVRNAGGQPAEEVLAPQPPFDPVRNAAWYNGAAALPLPAPYGLVVAEAQYEQLAPAGYTGEGYSFSESKGGIAKRIIEELPTLGVGKGRYANNATINELLPRCVKCLSPGDRSYLDEFIRTNHRDIYDRIVCENSVDKSIVIDYSKMIYDHFRIVRLDLISDAKNK